MITRLRITEAGWRAFAAAKSERPTWHIVERSLMAPRPFDCKFGVGQPDGCHSMVWKVWAAKNTDDVFITARWEGGRIKATLHEPRPRLRPERHVGLTGEYVKVLKSSQLAGADISSAGRVELNSATVIR
jgi:hypothetical protein